MTKDEILAYVAEVEKSADDHGYLDEGTPNLCQIVRKQQDTIDQYIKDGMGVSAACCDQEDKIEKLQATIREQQEEMGRLRKDQMKWQRKYSELFRLIHA